MHEFAASSKVVLLTGGLGGARLAPCLRDALGPGNLTVVANVGDDLSWLRSSRTSATTFRGTDFGYAPTSTR